MLTDAFRRIGRLELPAVPVVDSPADGYRTRARVHVRHGQWGFFEEGSHTLCDVPASLQMSARERRRDRPAVRRAGARRRRFERRDRMGRDGRRRACGPRTSRLEKADGKAMAGLGLVEGLDAATWSATDREKEHTAVG